MELVLISQVQLKKAKSLPISVCLKDMPDFPNLERSKPRGVYLPTATPGTVHGEQHAGGRPLSAPSRSGLLLPVTPVSGGTHAALRRTGNDGTTGLALFRTTK